MVATMKKIQPDELRQIMRQAGYNPTHQGKKFTEALGITNHCLRKWLNPNNPTCLITEKNGKPTIQGRGLMHLMAEREGEQQAPPETPTCAYCGGAFTTQQTNGNEGGRLTHTCPNGTETKTRFLPKNERERAVTQLVPKIWREKS